MELIKKRTIKTTNMTCSKCEEKIIDKLSKVAGVRSVKADHVTGNVYIVYDLLYVELKDIESVLSDIGYPVNKRLLSWMRDGFVHFTEENERDNLIAKPAICCSDPTAILAKAGNSKSRSL